MHRFQTVPGWLMTCLAALGAFAMVSMGGTAQAALLGLVVFLALPPVAKMVAPSGWVRGFAIVAGGPKEAPPVILTSASAMAGWLWHHNMAKLSADHRLYAIGNIGGVGKNALSDVGRVPSSRIVIVKGDHLIGAQIPDQVNPVIGDSLS